MKYYKVNQIKDSNYIINIPKIKKEEVENNLAIVKQINKNDLSIFLNFYEEPFQIVSDDLKQSIERIDESLIYKPIAITDIKVNFSKLYWILNLDMIVLNMSDRNLSIPLEKRKKIFKVKKGMFEHVIADIDIVELILQKSFMDIDFEEVQIYD